MRERYDVFISWATPRPCDPDEFAATPRPRDPDELAASPRRREVEELARHLGRLGLRPCVVADHTVAGGSMISEEIARTIADTPLYFALVDDDFLRSKWCLWELATAVHFKGTLRRGPSGGEDRHGDAVCWFDLERAYARRDRMSAVEFHEFFQTTDPQWGDESTAMEALRRGVEALAAIKSLNPPETNAFHEGTAARVAETIKGLYWGDEPSRRHHEPARTLVREIVHRQGQVALVIDARPDAASQLSREIYGLGLPPPWWFHCMDMESALEPLRTLEAALDNPSLKALVFAHRLLPLRPGGPMEAWSNPPPPPTGAPEEDEASDLRAKFQGALVDLHRRRDRVILSLLTSDPPSSQEPVKVPGLDDLRWRHTFTAPGYALLRERWSRDADWILRREPYRRPPALARDVAHLVVVGRNPDGHELGTRGNDEGYFQHFQGAAAVDLRRLEEDIGIAPLVALLARFDAPTVILTHARGGAFERLKSGITAVLRIDAEAAMTDGDPRAEAIVDQAVTTLTGGDVDGIEILVLGRPWVSPALREVTARIHGRLDARRTKITVVSPDEVSIPHEWTRWRPEPVVHRCFDLVDALHDMLLARDLPVGGLNEGQSPPGERTSEGS